MTTVDPAQILAIADAVTEELAGAQLSRPFVPQRDYISERMLEGLKSMRVVVAPSALDSVPASRSQTDDVASIDVGVMQKLGVGDKAEVDPIVTFANEIRQHFQGHVIAGLGAVCIGQRLDPVYDRDMFYNHRILLSIVRLEYRFVE